MKKTLSLLVGREGEWWVAQCLEYDIAVQARTLKDVDYEFQRILLGRIFAAKELGIDPFEDIPPAPEEYRKIFEDANKTRKMELRPMANFLREISLPFMFPKEALVYEY